MLGENPLKIDTFFSLHFQTFKQTEEWIHAPLLAQESPISKRRLLLEEAQRWQDDERGSYEAKSPRHRGESVETICAKL